MSITDIAERDQEIARLRREGLASLTTIAEHYGITAERVRQIAGGLGVDGRQAHNAYLINRSAMYQEMMREHETTIVTRWLAGQSPRRIAKDVGLPLYCVQSVVDEHTTDRAVSSRQSRHRLILANAGCPDGPAEDFRTPTYRRYWTAQRCWDALAELARRSGGRLPGAETYKEISRGEPMLPSLQTCRNRLGRWTYVRAEIHKRLSEEVGVLALTNKEA